MNLPPAVVVVCYFSELEGAPSDGRRVGGRHSARLLTPHPNDESDTDAVSPTAEADIAEAGVVAAAA